MTRMSLVHREHASGHSRELLDRIHAAFGATPNMFRAVAHSPAALQSMWAAFGALGGGSLPSALGERIAVAVAERNRCHYCLAAHIALGRKAGVSQAELHEAQDGRSADPRIQAALTFALQLVEQRGHVDAAAVQAVRQAGYSDEAIVEILAHVALNLFTNYVNVAFDVPVDFPPVALRGSGPGAPAGVTSGALAA
ncbi:MAG: peroxidase-related enzyme [Burkholderiales bacterium]|nr:peroxidase-related enzyme [Burkholderiales bacterium]